jgi:hypothetical protein
MNTVMGSSHGNVAHFDLHPSSLPLGTGDLVLHSGVAVQMFVCAPQGHTFHGTANAGPPPSHR